MTAEGAGASGEPVTRSRFRTIDGLTLVALLAAIAPVIVAAGARIAEHWQPADDEAAIARISHDVFSGNTPLLGMPSTISAGVRVTGGGTAHHLGPMLFWWFAIPDLVGRSSPNALVIAIALLNVVCIAGIAWVMRRHAGSVGALVALLAISILLVGLGRDVTVQIWNPYAALMPFLLFLVLAWAFANGDRVALPLAALVGSFTMQCHVLYVVPVVAVTIAALVALVLSERGVNRRSHDVDAWRRTRRRSWIATVVVLAVCWWTAAWDQLFHHGGNVTRLWNSLGGSSQHPLGFEVSSRYVLRALAIPPLFARHQATFAANAALLRPVGWWTTLSAIVVLLALAAGALRSSTPAFTRLAVLTLVTLGGAWYVLAKLPIAFGGPTPYRLRFVWIVSVYAWIAIVLVVGRALEAWFTARIALVRAGARRALAAVVVVVIVAGGVIASARRSPAIAVANDDTRAVTALTKQVRTALPEHGPYLLTLAGTHAFISTGFGVMWDLVRHGYDIRVLAGDPYLGAHHGVPRQSHIPRLLVVSSTERAAGPEGARRVARFDSAPTLPSELTRARGELVAGLARTPPRLTRAGENARVHSEAPLIRGSLRELARATPDWNRVLRHHTLVLLAQQHWIETAPALARLAARYDSLVDRARDSVFSVYVVPVPA